MAQMDFISSIFVILFFQNYLGSKFSIITRYRCIGWSVPTVCAFYIDSQTVETLRSACIYACAVWSGCLFQKAFWDKQCNFWPGFNVDMQPGRYFLQSPLFCEATIVCNLHHFIVNILITVLFRVLKLELNLVKFTFWTAIFSHQVMRLSLTKVWVIEHNFYRELINHFQTNESSHTSIKTQH